MRCTRIIFSGYRKDQFSDPEGYSDSLEMVLGQYPDDVILAITDPRTGVQSRCKWPPTIAEIIEAANGQMQDRARRIRLENWGKPKEPKAIESPRETRPTYGELKVKYGDNWGLNASAPKQPPRTLEQIQKSWEVLAKYYQDHPGRLRGLGGGDIED